ncbi:nuclear transport factor 2 family protein [Runella sp.]|uniref:nuclear transport factor 2 family protein n=1 Tax=Runella sp. TaxID=1960881 RepID=UPI003D0BBD27
MKKLLLSLLLFAPVSAFAQDLAKDTVAIKNVIADFFELFSQDDLKYMERNCTPEFELYEVGKLWTIDTLRNFVSKRQTQKRIWARTNEFRFIKFTVKKDIAWIGYYNNAYLTNTATNEKRTVRWLESAILVRKDREWWLTQMHSTPITK